MLNETQIKNLSERIYYNHDTQNSINNIEQIISEFLKVVKHKKMLYVSCSKPLVFKEFEENKSPSGWFRIDLLKTRIKEDKRFKEQFTTLELKEISNK